MADSGSDQSYHNGSGDDARFRSKFSSNRDNHKSTSNIIIKGEMKDAGMGLLRLSQSSSVSYDNNKMRNSSLSIGRRSIEQFESEFRYRNDDMVMFKSVTNSVDLQKLGIADSITSVDNRDEKPTLNYVSPPISIQSHPSRYGNKDDHDSDDDDTFIDEKKAVNFDADDKINVTRWGSAGGMEGGRKSVDSVDSAKREYLSTKKKDLPDLIGGADVGENKEALKTTGESSTVQTFDDSMGSLNDDNIMDDDDEFGNTADYTEYTVESVRKSVIRREADMYEIGARSNNNIRGFSSDSFADDDSLVFSESNNYDDL